MKNIFKIQLALILIFSGILLNYAQCGPMYDSERKSRYKNCDLQQKNSEWLNEITHEKDTATIISKIKSKIKSDTIYKSAKPKNINIKDGGFDYETIDRKGNLCGGKILFLLYDYGKNKILILDLNDNPALITIINNINENNVSVAVVSRPLDGIALYGSRGSSGAVILHTNDKNLKKIIRQMKKKNIEYLHRKGKRK